MIDTWDALPQDEAGLVLESFRNVASSFGAEDDMMKVAAAGRWQDIQHLRSSLILLHSAVQKRVNMHKVI